MTIHVVGGAYREYCVHPRWKQIYGSAGRAAIAIGTMGASVVLHCFVDKESRETLAQAGACLDMFEMRPRCVGSGVRFRYLHDLATPLITDVSNFGTLPVDEEKVVRFGMLDGDALVQAEWAVYDPQNVRDSQPFGANGSKAAHLALVLNLWEAAAMANQHGAQPVAIAPLLAEAHDAEVVIIKMGPQGAYVWSKAEQRQVPAFKTNRVWKIGSGDCFVGYFAYAWMELGCSPVEAAQLASKATAYYCDTQGFATPGLLQAARFEPVKPSSSFLSGDERTVYLAGPFFDLAQIWMVEQARTSLMEMGLKVFSPYHDVGLGSANDVVAKDLEALDASHVVFAIADSLDPGTLFEIGHARSRSIPVVVYSEQHHDRESLKMAQGTGCDITNNYTTAIYKTLWTAVEA